MHLTFISNRDGVRVDRPINFEVYRVPVGGGVEERLTTNNDFDADLAWGPAGQSLLFMSFQDQNDEVYLLTADGIARNLTQSPASDGGATWSPNGETILFHSDRGGENALRFYLMAADGTDVRPLPMDAGPGHSARWSPDGRLVAFVSDRAGNGEIYVMGTDGADVKRVTHDPRENGYPRWSPDGRTLMYTTGSFETDRWVLIAQDVTTGDSWQLVDDTDSGNATWSPDGKRIAFGRYSRYDDAGGHESRLHILDVTSGEVTRLPTAPAQSAAR